MNCEFQWWTDHSYDQALGARITTNIECGSLLLTILTLAVSIAGGACWTIIAYTLFQCLARKRKIAAFQAQILFLLINPTSIFSDFQTLLKTGWAWRKKHKTASRTFLVISSIALVFSIVSTGAHIAVSRVTITANNFPTPASSNPCGLVKYNQDSLIGTLIPQQHVLNLTRAAQAYKDQCYHVASDPITCNGFVVQELDYTTSNVDCPWNSTLCIGQAYQLDTMWIDSHEHLGINAESKDRVQARVVTTCAVIDAKDHRRIETLPSGFDMWSFYFTRPNNLSDPNIFNGGINTYSYSTGSAVDIDITYTLGSKDFYWNSTSNTSGAIPEFDRSDGTLTMLFLSSNDMTYLAPSNDPFFNISLEVADELGPGRNAYESKGVSVMACLDQVQLKNPNNNQTTPLQGPMSAESGIYVALDGMYALGFNQAQNATAKRIARAFSYTAFTWWNVNGLYSTALGANSLVVNTFSTGIPDNQWQIELAGWFDTGLAKLQQAIIDYVDNPWYSNQNLHPYMSVLDLDNLHEGDEQAFRDQCSSQLISGVATRQTFSALGVLIIAVAAPLIILIRMVLSKIVRKFGPTRSRNWDKTYRKQNILRMTLQSRGYGGWCKTKGDIPVRDHDVAEILPPVYQGGNYDIPYRGTCDEDLDGYEELVQVEPPHKVTEDPAR